MPVPSLSRRERQVLDVLHRLGRASAADVREALPDPPSDSAVRTHLRILEEKGHARHEQDGPRYVYLPVVESEEAGRSALRRGTCRSRPLDRGLSESTMRHDNPRLNPLSV